MEGAVLIKDKLSNWNELLVELRRLKMDWCQLFFNVRRVESLKVHNLILSLNAVYSFYMCSPLLVQPCLRT